MKKKFSLFIVAAIMCLIPVLNVKAEIESTDLKEAVAEEIEIFSQYDDYKDYVKKLKKFDADKYESSSDKITVYIFRGNSCTHCLEAVTYFAGIYPEYKDSIDVITYETNANQDNNTLMKNTGEYLGVEVTGVPFIVIGEKYFPGYAESLNSQIEEVLNDYIKNDSKYKDIVKKVIKGEKSPKKIKEEKTNTKVGYIILGITVVIIAIIVVSRLTNPAEYYEEDEEEETTATKKTTAKKAKTTTKSKK